MNEQEMNVELKELLTILKFAERKAIDSGSVYNARDIFIIHMAVIEAAEGSYDMDTVLETLAKVFGRGDEE